MNELTAPADRQQLDLSPRTFEQALQLADYMAKSEMVPKVYRGRPGDCFIAIQWGAEIGLKPLQAVQSIASINGKPNLYGDAGKALLLSHGCIIEEDDSELVKANSRARCKITRPGRPPVQRTFSLEDAKTAGLWNKEGPWRAYPWRQMAWRAFWFAARDAASDLLRGLAGHEEVLDLAPEAPRVVHMGVATEVPATEAAPAAAPAPALPPYSQAAFEKNLPSWNALIRSGKKSADQIVATLMAKAALSEQQVEGIYALATQAADSEVDELAEHADESNAAHAPTANDPPF